MLLCLLNMLSLLPSKQNQGKFSNMYLLQAETSIPASAPHRVKHHCGPSALFLSNSVYDPLPQLNTLNFPRSNSFAPDTSQRKLHKMGNVLSCTHVDLDSAVIPVTAPSSHIVQQDQEIQMH